MDLILLAKSAIENYISNKKTISPPRYLPKEFLEKQAGVFVTIKKDGRLRGCIGTSEPTKENIAQETISCAIIAASEDWRFGPVQKEELPYLSYEVYILTKPELIKNLTELDPKKYGIIVKTEARLPEKSGLLLPGLDGIETADEQISTACQKGGIEEGKEKIVIYRFRADKHE